MKINDNGKQIRFVTLFPNCPNIGLKKDVGQIPFVLMKDFDYDSKLVSDRIEFSGNYLDTVPGLKIERASKVNNEFLSGCIYLIKASRKIDWLNLYFCRKQTLIWGKIYKYINPKGKIYVKLDAGLETAEKIIYERQYRNLFFQITEVADCISVESTDVAELIQPYSRKKIDIIFNGVCEKNISINKLEKEKIFITVARIGSPEKNHALMMEAFAKSNLNDWKLYMVGPIEKTFQKYIDNYLKKHPEMKQRIIFTGEITNPVEIGCLLSKSRIFLMISKYENFSLAVAEAMANGCYVILSDRVSPKTDFLNLDIFGRVVKVDSEKELINAFLYFSRRPLNRTNHTEISKYALEQFSWINICARLRNKLVEI